MNFRTLRILLDFFSKRRKNQLKKKLIYSHEIQKKIFLKTTYKNKNST
jgi:hypothetical protein